MEPARGSGSSSGRRGFTWSGERWGWLRRLGVRRGSREREASGCGAVPGGEGHDRRGVSWKPRAASFELGSRSADSTGASRGLRLPGFQASSFKPSGGRAAAFGLQAFKLSSFQASSCKPQAFQPASSAQPSSPSPLLVSRKPVLLPPYRALVSRRRLVQLEPPIRCELGAPRAEGRHLPRGQRLEPPRHGQILSQHLQ